MKNFTISDSDLRSIIHIDSETRGRVKPQYICTCPFCGKEKHLYINKKTQMFDCKKCGTSGSIYKILKHLDKLYLAGQKTIEITDGIKSISQELEERQKGEEITLLPVVKLPVGFRLAINNKYLKSRGITKDQCRRYEIGFTDLRFRYANYILFPVYDNGEIRGYLGRYAAKDVPENTPRYNNSRDTDFAALLYGYDEIVRGKTETVIIVEGVFDKYALDDKLELYKDDLVKCVATFGKKISPIQIKKLLQKEIANVIISWDADALREIKQFGMEMQDYFNVSAAVAMNKKDVDECSLEEILDIFSNPQPITEFSWNTIGKIKR